VSLGDFSVAISASNASGTGSATLVLTVVLPHPVITSPVTAAGTLGNPFSYTIAAINRVTGFDATGLPPGLSVDTSTGVISGVPVAAGIVQITLSATNATGTSTATLALTIERLPGGVNIAPLFSSAPTADQIPGITGQPVNFIAMAADTDGDLLIYSWDFGDGTTAFGGNTIHSYTAAGFYTVTVTVSDGLASAVAAIKIPVNEAGSSSEPLQVQKMSLRFNFAKANQDALTLSGTLPVPAGFSSAQKAFVLSMGDFESSLTLNAKGSAADSLSRVKLAGKLAQGAFTGTAVKFTFATGKQDLFDKLKNLGFTNADVPSQTIDVPIIVELDSHSSLAKVTVAYAAKKNKTGSAKK
jgi:hypothetical protein